MTKLSLLPITALLLAACGGAHEGSAQAGTDQGPVLLAAAGHQQTMFDVKEAAPGPAQSYPVTQLAGARGNDGLYWYRQYTVQYLNGVIRIRSLPKDPQPQLVEEVPEDVSLVWKTWQMEVIPHQDATTYSAPTLDGRQAWLTVHSNGQIIGGGYHGTTSDSYLRLGNPEQDLPFAAVEDYPVTCWDYSPVGAPVEVDADGYQATVRYDRSRYPWASITVIQTGDRALDFQADPNGQVFQPWYGGQVSLRLHGDEVRAAIGAAAMGGMTEYRFRDGRLVSLEHSRRHVSTWCQ